MPVSEKKAAVPINKVYDIHSVQLHRIKGSLFVTYFVFSSDCCVALIKRRRKTRTLASFLHEALHAARPSFLSRRSECAANDSKLHFYDAITPSKSRVTLLFVINSARVARACDNLIGLIRLQLTATRCSIHSCLGHVGN
jgi:hypothetical protein